MGRPREPIYGVGINDAEYNTQPMVNGKKIWCKYASVWRDMLERCYSARFHEKYPSYKGAIVCEEWKHFSNFCNWMREQDYQGKQLDKDLLGDGKLYSPETCRFITQQTNSVLTKVEKSGNLPLGVQPANTKFAAKVREGGSFLYLGVRDTPLEAHALWQKAKAHSLEVRIKSGEECAEIVAALLTRINTLLLDVKYARETVAL